MYNCRCLLFVNYPLFYIRRLDVRRAQKKNGRSDEKGKTYCANIFMINVRVVGSGRNGGLITYRFEWIHSHLLKSVPNVAANASPNIPTPRYRLRARAIYKLQVKKWF